MFTPRLAVLGAGLMGVGIACHFARYGHPVRLYDTDPQRLAEVPTVAGAILRELEASGQQDPADRDAVLSRLTPTPALQALADATLLIEAIPERLGLKHALYAELETLIADEAIIASNTSGLPPDQLAQGMRLPERLLIAHFWHPPHLIPLVEVVPGSATLPHLARQVSDFCAACALEAVVLNRAGLCRQPAAVRPAARSAAYRPQRHRVPGGGGPGDARLAGPPLCDGRPAGGSGHDRPGDGPGYLPALAAGAGQRHRDDVAGGGESSARRHRRPQRARLLPLGRGPAPAHPVAPGTPAALRPETLVSRSVPLQ